MNMSGKSVAAIAAFFSLLTFAGSTLAGDFGGWNGPDLPSTTRWGDTYSGAVSIASFSHGTYFYIDREPGAADTETAKPQPMARILDGRKAQCAYEAGVCVIRP